MTLILSILGTGLSFTIWYNVISMGFEEQQATVILFVLLTVIQNLAIAFFTLPILFQIDAINYLSKYTKLVYLFASPLLVTIIISFQCCFDVE